MGRFKIMELFFVLKICLIRLTIYKLISDDNHNFDYGNTF